MNRHDSAAQRHALMLTLSLAFLTALAPPHAAGDAAAAIVSVQVLDSSGAPVPGLTVTVVPWEHQGPPRATPAQPHEQFITDAQGRITVPADQAMRAGGLHLWAVHGVECASRQLSIGSEEVNEHTVHLAPGRPVYGYVRSVGGQPLAGVQISYLRNVPLAVTTPDGLFTIPVFLDSGSLDYVKEGYACRSVNAWTRMEVVLEPGGALEGVVVDAAGPLAGARVNLNTEPGMQLITDGEGRFRTPYLQPGKEVQLSVWHTTDEAVWRGEARIDVVAEEVSSVTVMTEKTLRPVSDEEKEAARLASEARFTTISGRVVHAETGQPVQAQMYAVRQSHGDPSGLDYFKRRAGRTVEDGSFLIERVEKNSAGYLLAAPDEPLLHAVEGFVRVTVEETPITDLVLTVAPGAAVRGVLLAHDGQPVPNGQVALMGQTLHRVFFLKEGREFVFPNLPPGQYSLQSAGLRLQTRMLGPGEMQEDLELRLPSGEEGNLVAGVLRDTAGLPVGGVRISFENHERRQHASAETDAAGRFSTRIKEAGEYQVKVWETFSLALPRESASGGGRELPSVDPAVVEIGEGGLPRLDLVAERLAWPHPMLAGRIINEAGEPLQAELRILTDRYDSSNIQLKQGLFSLEKMPEGRFLLEASLKGYQARVLEAGRDFQRSDRELSIVLQPGPFPRRTPLWTLVTGRPATEAAVQEMYLGEEIRQREEHYRQLALPPQPAPANPEQQARPRPPSQVELFVTDPRGLPVERIVVQQAERIHHAHEMTQQTVQPARAGSTQVMGHEDGRYTVPNGSLIEAAGTARVLVHLEAEQALDAPVAVTLGPPARLRIDVRDYHGNPAPLAVAGPIRTMITAGNYGFSGATTADSAGRISFDALPEGTYAYAVAVKPEADPIGQAVRWNLPPRLVVFTAAWGEEQVREVVLPLANEHTTDALLVEWERRLAQNSRNPEQLVEAVAALGSRDRQRMAALATAQLAQMPGISGANVRQAMFFAQLSAALGEAAGRTLPEFQRLLRAPQNPALAEDFLPVDVDQWTQMLVDTVIELRGDRAKSFFIALVRDTDAPPASRRAALLVLLAEGDEQAKQYYVRLRSAARLKPEAPALKKQYTHAEKMAEAAVYTLSIIPGAPLIQPNLESAWVNNSFEEGHITCGTNKVHLRRLENEWLVTSLEPIPQVKW